MYFLIFNIPLITRIPLEGPQYMYRNPCHILTLQSVQSYWLTYNKHTILKSFWLTTLIKQHINLMSRYNCSQCTKLIQLCMPKRYSKHYVIYWLGWTHNETTYIIIGDIFVFLHPEPKYKIGMVNINIKEYRYYSSILLQTGQNRKVNSNNNQ